MLPNTLAAWLCCPSACTSYLGLPAQQRKEADVQQHEVLQTLMHTQDIQLLQTQSVLNIQAGQLVCCFATL